MSKRILVTGSEGTLGRPLVKELRSQGHEVFGLDLQHGEGNHRADVAEYRQVREVFDRADPDVVYHLAAEFGRLNGERWYEQLWRTNAIGTRNILEVCRIHESQLVFASSSEIYGEANEGELYEALSDEVPLYQPNEYALSKWVNEVQIRNFAARHYEDFIPPVVCRFFNAYGPGEHYHSYRSVVALFCYRALHDLPFTVFQNYYRTFMFIDDFIPTLASVHSKGQMGEVYNIGGKDYRSVEDLARIVLAEAGKGPEQVTYLSQDRHNVASKKPNISKAEDQLGHNPITQLESGVPSTIAWMKDRYGC